MDNLRWYHIGTDDIQVKVIQDLGDGRSLCQYVYVNDVGVFSTGNSVIIKNENLSEKPRKLVKFKEESDNTIQELRGELQAKKNTADKIRRELNFEIKQLAEHRNWLRNAATHTDIPLIKQYLTILEMLISGEDMYVFIHHSNYTFKIQVFNRTTLFKKEDFPEWDGLKLVSLYAPYKGYAENDFYFAFNGFVDGSSPSKSRFIAFRTKEEVVKYAENFILKYFPKEAKRDCNGKLPNYMDAATIETCKEWGVHVPTVVLQIYYESQIESKNNLIQEAQAKIDAYVKERTIYAKAFSALEKTANNDINTKTDKPSL